jgi:hypothetical protein
MEYQKGSGVELINCMIYMNRASYIRMIKDLERIFFLFDFVCNLGKEA